MSKRGKSPSAEALPYRPCVGAAIFNREGRVWIGWRADTEDEPEGSGTWWQMPQGGLEKGEDPEEAARRELFEETSITKVSLIREAPDWLTYDLPDELIGHAWRGRYRGQKQKWFAFRFEGDDSEIDVLEPGDGKHEAEFSTWKWEKLERLPGLVVPFKRGVYEQVVAAFRDVPDKS